MSLSSHNWFKYINEVRLNEGVRDIGLPEVVIDRIQIVTGKKDSFIYTPSQ